MSFCQMVANVTQNCHIQTAQYSFYLCKGSDPSYLVLKFGNICSSRNGAKILNVILQGCELSPWKDKSSIKIKKLH